MRISDWSLDVCSSDLKAGPRPGAETGTDQAATSRGTRRVTWAATFSFTDATEPRRSLRPLTAELGRASCRESVCQYVYISVVAVSLTKTHSLYLYPQMHRSTHLTSTIDHSQ